MVPSKDMNCRLLGPLYCEGRVVIMKVAGLLAGGPEGLLVEKGHVKACWPAAQVPYTSSSVLPPRPHNCHDLRWILIHETDIFLFVSLGKGNILVINDFTKIKSIN